MYVTSSKSPQNFQQNIRLHNSQELLAFFVKNVEFEPALLASSNLSSISFLQFLKGALTVCMFTTRASVVVSFTFLFFWQSEFLISSFL